jgi:hypothetical protein
MATVRLTPPRIMAAASANSRVTFVQKDAFGWNTYVAALTWMASVAQERPNAILLKSISNGVARSTG